MTTSLPRFVTSSSSFSSPTKALIKPPSSRSFTLRLSLLCQGPRNTPFSLLSTLRILHRFSAISSLHLFSTNTSSAVQASSRASHSRRKKMATSPSKDAADPPPTAHKPPGSSGGSLVSASANMERALGKQKGVAKQLAVRNVVAKSSSTTSYIQILGTGLDIGDTIPTVLLFFDQRRYIFNVGEGLQRFCMEYKVKLSKIDHVFFTRICSETAGGLPGLLLTMAGIGETGRAAHVWGPSDFKHLVNAMCTLVPNSAIVHTHSFGVEGNVSYPQDNKEKDTNLIVILQDELVKISTILLDRASSGQPKVNRTENKVGQQKSEASIDENHNMDDKGHFCSDIAVTYICELEEVKGKFDPNKATACGLKRGPKYGQLQQGRSVLSDDGKRMIHPEDVLGPSTPGPIVILVDCPTMSHLKSLTSAAGFQSFYSGCGKLVNCMVHLSPVTVTNCPEYQEWMAKFRDTHHILAGRTLQGRTSPILCSSAKVLAKLNFIFPEVFPVGSVPPEMSNDVSTQTMEQRDGLPQRIISAKNLLKFHLRPLALLGLDFTSVPATLDIQATLRELVEGIPEIVQAREHIKHMWKESTMIKMQSGLLAEEARNITPESKLESHAFDHPIKKLKITAGNHLHLEAIPECLQDVSREEMEIVFLGTCSSQPSKYRNVSAIYLHFLTKGGILLDCGEGTYGQLKRRFGEYGASDIILSLKCIWISHIHADHHTGLARILSVRRQLMYEKYGGCDPILVIGPRHLRRFLNAYMNVEDLAMDFLDCSQTTLEAAHAVRRVAEGEDAVYEDITSSYTISSRKGLQSFWQLPGFHLRNGVDVTGRNKLKELLISLGINDLISVPVVHCPEAFGVVLQGKERLNHAVATKPGWKLVYSGDTRPCQSLIDASRGATVLIHEATFDDSMLNDAITKNHSLTKEAIDVGVAANVYRIILTHFSQRYPKIPVFDDSYTDRTCIAFDMMSVNIADLPLLPQLLPALNLLFKDEVTADELLETNE